jgi:hypothetical protein
MSDPNNPILDAILRKRRQQTLLRVAGVAVVLIIGAFYWLYGRGEPGEPLPSPASPAADAMRGDVNAVAKDAAPAPIPGAEPTVVPDARPLPTLEQSDAFVRDGVARLSSRPEWITWLASDELIRRFVAAVDAIAQGESPVEQAPASMRPKGRFEVVPFASSSALDSNSGSDAASDAAAASVFIAPPATFARYDALTAVLTSLDPQGLVQSRRELAPLLDEAYHDLGHPDRSFDAALRDAIFALLSAPNVVGTPALEPLTLGHGYVDPALEELSGAKKQLLRFGPENVARLQQKIREVAIALGIPEAELPRTPRYEATTSR